MQSRHPDILRFDGSAFIFYGRFFPLPRRRETVLKSSIFSPHIRGLAADCDKQPGPPPSAGALLLERHTGDDKHNAKKINKTQRNYNVAT